MIQYPNKQILLYYHNTFLVVQGHASFPQGWCNPSPVTRTLLQLAQFRFYLETQGTPLSFADKSSCLQAHCVARLRWFTQCLGHHQRRQHVRGQDREKGKSQGQDFHIWNSRELWSCDTRIYIDPGITINQTVQDRFHTAAANMAQASCHSVTTLPAFMDRPDSFMECHTSAWSASVSLNPLIYWGRPLKIWWKVLFWSSTSLLPSVFFIRAS